MKQKGFTNSNSMQCNTLGQIHLSTDPQYDNGLWSLDRWNSESKLRSAYDSIKSI